MAVRRIDYALIVPEVIVEASFDLGATRARGVVEQLLRGSADFPAQRPWSVYLVHLFGVPGTVVVEPGQIYAVTFPGEERD
jgi:hypothetical protein